MIESWIKSFSQKYSHMRIGSVRAGNVIGGGDWATNRLIPDAFRSYQDTSPLSIRNPNSIRPWQHVVDP